MNTSGFFRLAGVVLFIQSLIRLRFQKLRFVALMQRASWLASMTLSAQPGGLDSSFTAAVGAPEQGDDKVNALIVQPDGRVVIAGQFSEVNAKRKLNLARLNPDGTLDDTFDSAARADGTVWALALQPGGRIVLGGSFGFVNGTARAALARLNPDGTLDSSFASGLQVEAAPTMFRGFGGPIESLVPLPDGKLLAAGRLTRVNGVARSSLARFNADGTLDASFDANAALNDLQSMGPIAVQCDGKILVSLFLKDSAGSKVLRLQTDGALDTAFAPVKVTLHQSGGAVYCLQPQPDGSLVFGGSFRLVNGQPRTSMARVHADGTLDQDYAPPLISLHTSFSAPFLYSMARQADGFLLIGGQFVPENGLSQNLARLHPDGSVDPYFVSGKGPDVSNGFRFFLGALALQEDGQILMGGHFRSYDGLSRARIARIRGGNAQGLPARIARQPGAKIEMEGGSALFAVRAVSPEPMRYQWLFNGMNVAGATNPVLRLQNIQIKDAGEYRVVISNSSGSTTSSNATLQVVPPAAGPGSLDPDFSDEIAAASGASLAVQPDGRVWVRGAITGLATGQAHSLVRLNPEGRFDRAFAPEFRADAGVFRPVLVQSDGRIVSSSVLHRADGGLVNRLFRVNSDGATDPGFSAEFQFSESVAGEVLCLVQESDGKILVGGVFAYVNGQPSTNLARLNPDGRLDRSFVVREPFSIGFAAGVYAIALDPNGNIIIGGAFTSMNGVARHQLARLHRNGDLDLSFHPIVDRILSSPGGSPHPVRVSDVAIQSDGKIIVAGHFAGIDGWVRYHLARLGADGSVDPTFDAGLSGGGLNPLSVTMNSVVVQPDGQLVVGGRFNTVQGKPRSGLARLLTDGTLDSSFDPRLPGGGSTGFTVDQIALLGGTRLMITGTFGAVNGATRHGLAVIRAGSLPGKPPVIETQPEGQTVRRGEDLTFNVSVNSAQAVRFQWKLNGNELAGANSRTLSVTNAQLHNSGLYTVIISSASGTIESQAALLTVLAPHPNLLDDAFDPGGGADGVVFSSALDADGKLIIGGAFAHFNGAARPGVARVNPDGTLDGSFNPALASGAGVRALAVLRDGKILVGQAFTNRNSALPGRITRLHPDGALDAGFQTVLEGGTSPFEPPQALALAVAGEKLIVGGQFQTVNGIARSSIAQLNADGSLDQSFAPPNSATVLAVAVQPDGKVLVARADGVYRLETDGRPDGGFVAPSGFIRAIALQADGKIIIGGQFGPGFGGGGTGRTFLARLNSNGSLDRSFQIGSGGQGGAGFGPDIVNAVALQSDGKIVIGGWFTLVNGCPCYRVARLFPDGRLDLTFLMNPGATDGTISRGGFRGPLDWTQVHSVVVQKDDAIFIAGDFTKVNGAPRRYVARLFGASFAPSLFDPKVGSGGFRASFLQTAAGADYELEFKDSLADAVWQPVPSLAEGTVVKTITDPATAAGQRFYRLRRKN